MIKAVIFDMDGLLIDSEPLWREAEIEIFTKLGVPLTNEKTFETLGFRVDETVEHWFSRYPWKGSSKKEIEKKIIKRAVELIKERGIARKGAKEVINFFINKQIPIAIASSSPGEIIDAVLDKISIRKYVNVIHSAENESHGKPHPGVYITTSTKLNVHPEYCLVFEDSPNGVLAAKAAKMKCIAVPDETVKDNKIFNIADMTINSLEDFQLEHLKNFDFIHQSRF